MSGPLQVQLEVPADRAFAPLIIRLLRRMQAIPDGPGEAIETLIPAVETALARSLDWIQATGTGGRLKIRLMADATHFGLHMEAGTATAAEVAPGEVYSRQVLDAFHQVFDEVEQTIAPGRGLRLRLVRRLPV